MDPLRLAAQIVSGVGFIGAGVILKKGHDSVSGLTTAALIWSASGIGIAVGAGFYFAAILAVILLILSVEVLPLLFALFGLKPLGEKEIILQLMLAHSDQYSIVIDKIKQQRIAINYIHIKDLDGTHQLHLKVSVDHKRNMLEIFQHVSEIEGIQGVEIESI